ncbi:TetR/AcrR family transcriptional regulator [Streptomyces sp. NPDC002889]|uniref:TetR/AcrR family transcriptional regulator n=1 Tax=Streptomyces sp. NPDC002889 TaxID=3364669 RepID=UPI0036CE7A91
MDSAAAREQVLDAAEELYYARGIQTVGMDAVRAASGVSLKRLYQLFPAKEALVEAYLRRRDVRWRQQLADRVDRHREPRDRILAVYDRLHEWFAEPGFHGCAWINSYGELGATSPAVADLARSHKQAFQDYLTLLVTDAGLPADVAGQLHLLAEGAITTAAIFGTPGTALQAKEAAARLLDAAGP